MPPEDENSPEQDYPEITEEMKQRLNNVEKKIKEIKEGFNKSEVIADKCENIIAGIKVCHERIEASAMKNKKEIDKLRECLEKRKKQIDSLFKYIEQE